MPMHMLNSQYSIDESIYPTIYKRTKKVVRQTVFNGDFWRYVKPGQEKIGYIGWLNHRNLGDEVMYKSFRKLFPKADVISYQYEWHAELERALHRRLMFDGIFLSSIALCRRQPDYLFVHQ